MSDAVDAISEVAWKANSLLSSDIEAFEKARARLVGSLESSSAAVIALSAINGSEDVIRRGHELHARAAQALAPATEGAER